MKTKILNYKKTHCKCCGQSLTYVSKLNKGIANMMLKIGRFVSKKGLNVFHPSKELVNKHFFTGNERNNMIHLKAHGFVAKHKEPGNWVITKKGGRFLKGFKVERIAVRSKETKHTIGYIEDEYTRIGDILKTDEPYWDGIDYEVISGRVVTQD